MGHGAKLQKAAERRAVTVLYYETRLLPGFGGFTGLPIGVAHCAQNTPPTNQPLGGGSAQNTPPTNHPSGSVDFSGFEWIRPLWSLPTPPSAASSPHSINHTREWPRPDRYRHAFITPRTGLNPGEIGLETARVFDQRTETPPIEATAVSGGFEL